MDHYFLILLRNIRKILSIATLMLVGEFVFLLPFVVTRIFRPTFLQVFAINNFQLGTAFSFYGVVAMISYFLGGPIADRYTPRVLLPVSLLATSIGGVMMASIPSLFTLTVLYGLWGLTSILLFWSAYVKAQREIGGKEAQGRSFGAIDAGRGFVAAALASASVVLLDFWLPVSANEATTEQLKNSLTSIIWLFSATTAFGAMLVWLFLPNVNSRQESIPSMSLKGVRLALRERSIWIQSLIVLCAYVGYKCTDDFSLYANVALGYDQVQAAHLATVSFWTRPIAAIAAGVLGDKIQHSKVVTWCFAIMTLGSLCLASGILKPGMMIWILMTIAITSVGIYGLRGLYYALFLEAGIPLLITGSATGIVAVIGYTPDVFFGPLMGWILDSSPGAKGHAHLFGLLCLFSIVGWLASIAFRKEISRA